jgi:hypothetical protein
VVPLELGDGLWQTESESQRGTLEHLPVAVTIIARCHPGLEELLPPPVPARQKLPSWVKSMPSEAVSETLSGTTVRTLKQCPPILDAFSLGIILPLVCDIVASGGELSWDWQPPKLRGHSASRAPIGMHVPEQARGAPFEPEGLFIKFTNFWTLETPPGWQILFTHPLNRFDLPFQSLTGLVDTDRFGHGYVHFPARWLDHGWEGTLPRGTPVIQAIPVPRGSVEMGVCAMTPEDIAATESIQQSLHGEKGVYRKRFRLRAAAQEA